VTDYCGADMPRINAFEVVFVLCSVVNIFVVSCRNLLTRLSSNFGLQFIGLIVFTNVTLCFGIFAHFGIF